MSKGRAGLGPVQQHVLLVLDVRGACSANDWSAWYPYPTESIPGAINRLGRRGLVDAAGFDGRSRTYDITAKGRAVVQELCDEGLELEE